jgi:NAD(P)-dependent dehydrogenase (short-subunit alcohol dehydrogenase family)
VTGGSDGLGLARRLARVGAEVILPVRNAAKGAAAAASITGMARSIAYRWFTDPHSRERFRHSRLGDLELHCQTLQDPESGQSLLVFTAAPGSESYEKLQLLSVIGDQRIGPPATAT